MSPRVRFLSQELAAAEEQAAYWKAAYERMAARNHELAGQLAAIKRIEQGQAKERAAA